VPVYRGAGFQDRESRERKERAERNREKEHQRSAVTKDGRSGPSCSVHHDPQERSHLFGPIRLMAGTTSGTLALFHAIDLVEQCSRFTGGGGSPCAGRPENLAVAGAVAVSYVASLWVLTHSHSGFVVFLGDGSLCSKGFVTVDPSRGYSSARV